MARTRMLYLLLAATMATAASALAETRHGHGAHARRHQARRTPTRYAGSGYGRPYSSSVSPTITCYYADGTPYDPDVIGGPNHVGAGGPAANLGGFDPCE